MPFEGLRKPTNWPLAPVSGAQTRQGETGKVERARVLRQRRDKNPGNVTGTKFKRGTQFKSIKQVSNYLNHNINENYPKPAGPTREVILGLFIAIGFVKSKQGNLGPRQVWRAQTGRAKKRAWFGAIILALIRIEGTKLAATAGYNPLVLGLIRYSTA